MSNPAQGAVGAETMTAGCAARRQGSAGGNDPTDCDWPMCGCDPHADKVIAALQECGHLSTPAQPAGAVPDSLRALSEAEEHAHFLGMAGARLAADGFLANAASCSNAAKYLRTLASHPAGQSAGSGADGWLPIETAPRDGTYFDAWAVQPETGVMGVRFSDVQMRGDGSGFGIVIHRPRAHWEYLEQEGPTFPAWKLTHWRPRPAGPGKPAPDSTRTGQGEALPTVENTIKRLETVRSNARHANKVWLANTAHYAAEWLRPLAARPAAPEAQGAWSFDMEAAPRDGTVILLWREGWGEPSAAYWGLAPMADGAGIATKRHPWVFLDSTNGVNGYEDGGHGPMAWHPMLDAPAPPASSGQGGR